MRTLLRTVNVFFLGLCWNQLIFGYSDFKRRYFEKNKMNELKEHKLDFDNFKTYRSHAVLRAIPRDQKEVELLQNLSLDHIVDYWRHPIAPKRMVDMMVGPNHMDSVVALISKHGIPLRVLNSDVQGMVAKEFESIAESMANDYYTQKLNGKGDNFNLTKYHSYDSIMAWLDHLDNYCNNILCSAKTIGKSSEGRDIKVIQISDDLNSERKPVIWIDAGFHAREWIGPATAINLIHQLLHSRQDVIRLLVRKYDWHILPLSNPDGYVYSWTKDRLWRKNRSMISAISDDCIGVDLNRNWNFNWHGEGMSKNPCTENYSGPHYFSEPETRAISEYLLTYSSKAKLYLSLHSYGQYWLTPWSFKLEYPDDYDDLMWLGAKAVKAIKQTSGKQYTVGSASHLLYLATGGSDDWAKGVAGIKYAYTVELRDKGEHAFMLPSSQIKPTSEEIITAITRISLELLKI